MAWFRRKEKKLKNPTKKSIPDGLWGKCPSCDEIIYRPELEKNLSVCHHCNHHFRVPPEIYKNLLIDEGSDKRCFENIKSVDFLGFKAKKAYKEGKSIVDVAHEETGISEAELEKLLDPAKLTKGGISE